MSKSPTPRSSVRKLLASFERLSNFDIRSIPKKPPAPSLTRRRSRQAPAAPAVRREAEEDWGAGLLPYAK
jgi:hypothetical protein